jgi:DNA-binding NtrC family response regulator
MQCINMRPMRVALLQIDDEVVSHLLVARSLKGWREDEDLRIRTARSPAEGLDAMAQESFHVALVDLHYGTDQPEGFKLIRGLREADPSLEIIVVSSSHLFSSVQEAMRAGANDYVAKGYGPAELRHALNRALERRRWKSIERRASKTGPGGFQMVGEAPAMIALKTSLQRFASTAAPVLLEGETGAGKEVAAKALHLWGRDPASAFVPVNCAAVPATTADSFFFGHEKGAFTGADRSRPGVFEEADGGTLFLDEVNSLSPDLQGRLLRVLQEREVRRLGGQRTVPVEFRLITASNQALEELVAQGKFREDLYFRLAVLRVGIPPLRERASDILALAASFYPKRTLKPELLSLFEKHRWPGNVRELRNLLAALDALTPAGEALGPEALPEHALRQVSGTLAPAAAMEEAPEAFAEAQTRRERKYLEQAYRQAGGNISRMARELKVDRSHLHQKLVEKGVHRPRLTARG